MGQVDLKMTICVIYQILDVFFTEDDGSIF